MTKRGKQRRRHALPLAPLPTPPRPRMLEVVDAGTLRVESSQLAPPREQYDADYAWVAERNGAVSFFFAKGDAGRDGLVSRVEVRYSYEAFVGHFWESSRAFHAQTREQLASSPLMSRAGREHRKPETLSPMKQHSLWANLDVIARTGTGATLDFHHLPPASVARFKQSGDRAHLDIVPVLRVSTTIFEVLRLLDASEAIVNDLKPLLRSLEIDDAQR